jgi:protein-S-isoprenylcysteine O-methyltransferase Ste14
MSQAPTSEESPPADGPRRKRRRFTRSRRPRGWFEPAFLVTGFVFTMLTPSPIPERMQMWVEPVISGLGWALIVGGGAMRLWASLYIGGWKSERLMTEGPYSICRNPLYLGSVTTGAGFALLLNSGVLLVAVGAVALVYTLYLVPHEERRLADRFGERYQHYRQQTPMLWPRWRGFRTQPVIQVHLRSLAREFWRVIVWGLVAVGAELFADEMRGPMMFQMLHDVV